MNKTLKLHPASVSAVLRKAGLEQAKWLKSGQIRGWGHWTRGFDVQVERDGYRGTDPIKWIDVGWIFGDWGRHAPEENREQYLEQMRGILVERGYVVQKISGNLRVTLADSTRKEK